jgi:hypothetical protein
VPALFRELKKHVRSTNQTNQKQQVLKFILAQRMKHTVNNHKHWNPGELEQEPLSGCGQEAGKEEEATFGR